jgi:hypothetical protein
LDSFIQEANFRNAAEFACLVVPIEFPISPRAECFATSKRPQALITTRTATAVPTIMPPPCHRSTARNDNHDETLPPPLPLHAVLSSLRPLSGLYDASQASANNPPATANAPQPPLRLRNSEEEDLRRARLVYILNEALRITASLNELRTMDGPDKPLEHRRDGRE